MGEGRTSVGFVLAAFARHCKWVAIRHPQGEWTYGELADRIYRMARALRAEGLGRGDVVTLLTGNRADTIVLRYMANVLGCCVSVLYDGLASSTLADILRRTGASALVFAPDRYADQALAVLDELPNVAALTLGEFPGGVNLSALAQLSKNDVVGWVREKRGGLYQPDVVLVLDELPRTGSHKPDRTALRRMVTRCARLVE